MCIFLSGKGGKVEGKGGTRSIEINSHSEVPMADIDFKIETLHPPHY